MTWQRIDENTYIDDTLVTCAEYQLFIDEMRTLGKYYQPDHWTSYQFPEGQAREPILGVRQSDAIAFCEWLTKRETDASGAWEYRIPKFRERRVPIRKSQLMNRLGYWKIGPISFEWAGQRPKDARKIEIPQDILDLALFHDPAYYLTKALKLDFIVALQRALKSAVELHSTLNFAPDSDLNRIFIDHLSPACIHACELNVKLNREVPCVFPQILSVAGDLAIELAYARELAEKSDLFLALSFRRTRQINIERYYHTAIDLFIDLLTLRERIARRSPAFEGIRLVKERIR